MLRPEREPAPARVPQLATVTPRPEIMGRSSSQLVADVPLLRGQSSHSMPAELAKHGVSQVQFDGWMHLIEQKQIEGNAFGTCPCVGVCYWCCPFLCIQPLICMANPLTWWMTLRVLRLENKRGPFTYYSAILANHTHLPLRRYLVDQDMRVRDAMEDRIRDETPESLHFRWTLWQHAVWEQTTLFEIRLQQPGIHPEPPPATIPAKLLAMGATQDQWTRWRAQLLRERRAHLLHSCPSPYASFAYSFFPFGGLQPCICILNPATWLSAHKVHRVRKEAEAAINADLAQLGCNFRFEPNGRTAIFARGPPPLTKRKKGGIVTVVLQGGGFGIPVPGTARNMMPSAEEPSGLAEPASHPQPVRV